MVINAGYGPSRLSLLLAIKRSKNSHIPPPHTRPKPEPKRDRVCKIPKSRNKKKKPRSFELGARRLRVFFEVKASSR